MDGFLTNIAKFLSSDSPIEAWKFCNWLRFLWIWPFIPLMVISGKTTLKYVVISVLVISTMVLVVMYHKLRRTLIAKGIEKTELAAFTKGIGRSNAASIVVAVPVLLGTVFVLKWTLTSFGVWDSVDQVNLMTKLAGSYAMIALSGCIGWLLWGRRVYSKRVIGLTI